MPRAPHPIVKLLVQRVALGVVTLWVVSVVIFAATQVLPGNAAVAILGHSATPCALHALERQLHLNRSVFVQYGAWISGILGGHPGTSLVNGMPVWSVVRPAAANSAVLVGLSGVIGSVVGVTLGAVVALRKDSLLDHASSVLALAVTALPEFVVAIAMIILFATVVWDVLPAVSMVPPGTQAWAEPRELVLPVATLVIVIVPYIFRMTRAATVEALGVGLRRDGPAEGAAHLARACRPRPAQRDRAGCPGDRAQLLVPGRRDRRRGVRVRLPRHRLEPGQRGGQPGRPRRSR